jgi:predicted RNase H-like HicB family nuclease
MNIKIIVHKAEEGGYWAEVPALPGCVSQGETTDEIRNNIREAIELWLETGEDQPYDMDQAEVLELAV